MRSLLALTLAFASPAIGFGAESAPAEESEQSPPVADRSLSGTVDGSEWAAGSCVKFGDQSTDGVVHCLIAPSAPPQAAHPATPRLGIYLPKKAGTYKLENSTYVTFPVQMKQRDARVGGQLVVYSVSETAIEFGLSAKVDKDNDISGKFTFHPTESAPAAQKP